MAERFSVIYFAKEQKKAMQINKKDLLFAQKQITFV